MGASGFLEVFLERKQIRDLLVKHQLKCTRIRIGLLGFLNKRHGPFTVHELHREARLDCNLTSIYRACCTLEEAGLLRSCDFKDGTVRYEGQFNSHEHHHHIVCRSCKVVKSVRLCLNKGFELTLSDLGFSDISHQLEFFGLCENCS